MAVSLSSAAIAAVSAAHSGSDGTREAGGIQALKDLFVGDASVEWVSSGGTVLATQTATLTAVNSIRPAKLRVELIPTTYAFVAAGTAATCRLKNGSTLVLSNGSASLSQAIASTTTGIGGVFWIENLTTIDSVTCETIRNDDSSAWTNRGVAFMAWFTDGQIANYPELVDPGTGNAYASQQCNRLLQHASGNCKMAMMFLVVPSLAAGATLTPKFRNKTTSNNTPLTIAQMTAAGFDFDCEIRLNGGGAGLSAKARTMLTAVSDATLAANTAAWSPDSRYEYAGPLCTVVRIADHTGKAYDIGAETTKSVRPWFIAWFWAHDNTWECREIRETTDSAKLQNCTYSLGVYVGNTSPTLAYSESSRIHYASQGRTTVVRKAAAARPKIGLKPNLKQLCATKLIPQYDPTQTVIGSVITGVLSAWGSAAKTGGDAGLWGQQMGAVAARPEIGPITHWDALYMYDGRFDLRDMVERNLDLAGGWQIWMRAGTGTRGGGTRYYDELNSVTALGRWQSRDAFPNARWVSAPAKDWASPDAATWIGSTTAAPSWSADTAHQPSFGGVAYLLGGDPYYLDRMIGAFGFNVNYLVEGSGTATPDPWQYQSGRDPKDTPFNHEQVRSNGWDLRTRDEVATLAPDGMPEKVLALRCITNGLQAVNGKVASTATNGNAIHDWFYGQRPGGWAPYTVGYMSEVAYVSGGLGYPRSPDSSGGMAPWMHHFWTISVQRAAEKFGSYAPVAQADSHFQKFAREMALGKYPQGGIEYIYPARLSSTGGFPQSHAAAVASDATSGAKAWNWPDAQTTDNDGYRNQYSANVAMMATKSARGWKAWKEVIKPNIFDACTWGNGLKYCVVPRG